MATNHASRKHYFESRGNEARILESSCSRSQFSETRVALRTRCMTQHALSPARPVHRSNRYTFFSIPHCLPIKIGLQDVFRSRGTKNTTARGMPCMSRGYILFPPNGAVNFGAVFTTWQASIRGQFLNGS